MIIGDSWRGISLKLVYLSGSPAEEHVSTSFGGKVKVGLTTIVGVIFVTIIIGRNWTERVVKWGLSRGNNIYNLVYDEEGTFMKNMILVDL